jgi:excisionase family DNA binding protein
MAGFYVGPPADRINLPPSAPLPYRVPVLLSGGVHSEELLMVALTEKLLTVNEVAEKLRCTRWGIYGMARDGRLPCVRLSSRRLLFTEEAVLGAIKRAECNGTENVA